MTQSPFNFNMAIPCDPDTHLPVRMDVLECRESRSRRRGTKVTVGFKADAGEAGVAVFNLGHN